MNKYQQITSINNEQISTNINKDEQYNKYQQISTNMEQYE